MQDLEHCFYRGCSAPDASVAKDRATNSRISEKGVDLVLIRLPFAWGKCNTKRQVSCSGRGPGVLHHWSGKFALKSIKQVSAANPFRKLICQLAGPVPVPFFNEAPIAVGAVLRPQGAEHPGRYLSPPLPLSSSSPLPLAPSPPLNLSPS